MKPDLSLYIGRRVLAVEKLKGGQAWQWNIVLEGNVRIVNKSREEVFPPQFLEGKTLQTIIFSLKGTELVFDAFGGVNSARVGLKPTQYAIQDPVYGGETYPQWPEELEEAGIPSHPEEEVSAQPSAEWSEHEKKLHTVAQARRENEAREFLSEEGE